VPLLGDCGEVVGALLATCRKSAGQQDKAALKGWWREIDGCAVADCLTL